MKLAKNAASLLGAIVVVTGCGGGGAGAGALGPTLTSIGDLPGGPFSSALLSVSADGTVGLGMSWDASGQARPIRWNRAGGITPVTTVVFPGRAVSISEDLQIIIGQNSDNGFEIRSGVYQDMILPPGYLYARPESGNRTCRVVVGQGSPAPGDLLGVVWKSDGTVISVGDLPGGETRSSLSFVDAEGTVAVGFGHDASGMRPVKWTAERGLEVIPGSGRGSAIAVSRNGQIIVGVAGDRGFRFTSARGYELLPVLAHAEQVSPTCINEDGSVILGVATTFEGGPRIRTCWILTAGGRMQLFSDFLKARGISAPFKGWENVAPTAVSSNGRVIVGQGSNPNGASEGWIVNL